MTNVNCLKASRELTIELTIFPRCYFKAVVEFCFLTAVIFFKFSKTYATTLLSR